jgi:DNA-binding MarR family transcriptional regulator
MSMSNRTKLIKELNSYVQDNGNTNVLLVHAIAQHINLSATEFECWSLITSKGPFTAGELARHCHITTGGMTGMLDRLERGGFIVRMTDPDDRRRVLVQALQNETALHTILRLYQPLREAFDELLDQYSDQELAFIADFMCRVNAMFHAVVDALPDKHACRK